MTLRRGVCWYCHRPDLPAERQGERHVATRFGDYRYRVFLAVDPEAGRDVEVSRTCIEAYAGRAGEGWVLCVTAPDGVLRPAIPYGALAERCPLCHRPLASGQQLLTRFAGTVRIEIPDGQR